jgi:transcriptional regulator with XRE-family HTH domain
MTRLNKIITPKILPNNLLDIRENKGLSLKEVGLALKINPSFLRAVEQERANFSGKSTIKALKFYDVNYYLMYDINDTRTLLVDDEFREAYEATIKVTYKELLGSRMKNYDLDKDIAKLKRLVKTEIKENLDRLRDNDIILAKINSFSESNNIEGRYYDFDIDDYKVNSSDIALNLTVYFLEKREEEMEFDIRLAKNHNHKLFKEVGAGKYEEVFQTITRRVDGESVVFKGDHFLLDTEYKIAQGQYGNKTTVSNKISIDNESLTVLVDKETNKPTTIKFRVIGPQLNNLEELRRIKGYSEKDMEDALGISRDVYRTLEIGSAKISYKILWKLVQLYNIPVEGMINIDEYHKMLINEKKKESLL